MNTDTDSNDRLRWQLRALQRELPPSRDLWPGIATRIAATPQSPPRPAESPRSAWRRFTPWASAASVLLLAGLLWRTGALEAPREAPLLPREAAAMTRDYQGALAQLPPAPTSPEVAGALEDLDRSAQQIRSALDAHPDARFLLDKLRRTYARRLALTQRLAMT